MRIRGVGRRANEYVQSAASRVDGGTQEAAARIVQVVAPTVQLLRLPSLALVVVPLPLELATLALALSWDGTARWVGAVVALAMLAVTGFFALRRKRILDAVGQPAALATELAIAINLTDRVEETRGVLTQVGGGGGVRIFSRLHGAWRGVGMPARWMDGVGDLPRARYFVPPRLGTTITGSLAALWMVPVSAIVLLFALVATAAGTF